jgi:hypothetical protein
MNDPKSDGGATTSSDQPGVLVSLAEVDGVPVFARFLGRNITWEIDGAGRLVLFRAGQAQAVYAPGVWRTVTVLPIPD